MRWHCRIIEGEELMRAGTTRLGRVRSGVKDSGWVYLELLEPRQLLSADGIEMLPPEVSPVAWQRHLPGYDTQRFFQEDNTGIFYSGATATGSGSATGASTTV